MQKRVKTTLLWNGTDFGWPGSDSLIIDLLSNAQRYMRAITTFVDVRKITTKDELNAHFSDVTKQFIEYMRWSSGAVLDPQRVSGIKIKLDSARGLPKFSLKYQKNEYVTVVYVFRISNKYGIPIAKILRGLNQSYKLLGKSIQKQEEVANDAQSTKLTGEKDVTFQTAPMSEADHLAFISGCYAQVDIAPIPEKVDVAIFVNIETAKKVLLATQRDVYFVVPANGRWNNILHYKYSTADKCLTRLLLEYKEDVLQQTPEPKHGSAADATALNECKPGIVIKAKIDDSVGGLLSDSFKRLST